MAKKRTPTKLAQPPWTYAPAEVMDWLGSGVAKGRKDTPPRFRLVREISLQCTRAEGSRAVRRFQRLVAKAVRGRTREPGVTGPSSTRGEKILLEGRFAGVHVRLRARPEADRVFLHFALRPPLSEHRAHRLLTELGVRPILGRHDMEETRARYGADSIQ